ncbi:cytochrome P450 [Actinoalloteichus hoggarensis]|uniref:Biotin biosynthesis cytochrome P450 n=1 Tax=Actinoalloteichus hoggarensis TaxID=1470176 RepID=A0A221W4U7_9PSEU|nr:cytochrome P450 [Actinoalloteichus hoggarensis]ASO20676.1 Biotin biosynthesis cytochrome P450 [Actinoalloteichus hoggarensis]MBB5924471.1 cytochrome P450 [Actinoalloteichus hoggarensis]
MTRIPSPEGTTEAPPGAEPLPGGLGWLVSDRALAVRLLSHEGLGVVEAGPVMAALADRLPPDLQATAEDLGDFASRIMLQAAPERHRVLRRAFGRFFTADAVDAMVPGMRADAERVVGTLAAAGGGDFMTAVAFPYAAAVASRLLGLPTADFLRLHRLSQRLAVVAYALRSQDPADTLREGHDALTRMRALIREARATAPRDTVLAEWRDSGISGLSDADAEANVVMLVQASLETVAGMIGNGAVRILGAPGTLADPVSTATAIDEAVRHEPPLKTLERVARSSINVDGHLLRAGQIVSVRVAAANSGGDAAGTAVLSYGWGLYRCLGARMARAEALALFDALRAVAPGVTATDTRVERVRHIRFDMPRRLPLNCPAPGRVGPEPPAAEISPTDTSPARTAAATVATALESALEEHDRDRPLTSLEREVAAVVLTEHGVTLPEPLRRPKTIRGWVAWVENPHG